MMFSDLDLGFKCLMKKNISKPTTA